jgi:hypothetical protein
MVRPVRKCRLKLLSLSKAKNTHLRLENDPRFVQRIEKARNSLRAGRGVRLEDI